MASFQKETLFKWSKPRNEAQRRSSCFGEPSWKVGGPVLGFNLPQTIANLSMLALCSWTMHLHLNRSLTPHISLGKQVFMREWCLERCVGPGLDAPTSITKVKWT